MTVYAAYHPHDQIVPTETPKNKGVSLSLQSSPRQDRPPARAARRAPLADQRPGPSSQSARSPSAAQHITFHLGHFSWTLSAFAVQISLIGWCSGTAPVKDRPPDQSSQTTHFSSTTRRSLGSVHSFVFRLPVVSRSVCCKRKAGLCHTQSAGHQPLAQRSRDL